MRSSSSAARGPGRQPARAQRLGDGGDLLLPDRGRLEAELWCYDGVRIDQEAYGLRRTASPGQRVVAVAADGEHRTGPVGAAPQRPEAPAGPPVGPHPLDALDRRGLAIPSVARSTPSGATRKRTHAPPTAPAALRL